MDEQETLEWLNLGLEIIDDLNDFRINGRNITQMSIKDLKTYMSTESSLMINNAIVKASKRDLQKFDFGYAEILKVNELPPIEGILNGKSMSGKNADESIISLFGGKFLGVLKTLKKELWDEKCKKVQKKFSLNGDDMLVYVSFLRSITIKEHSSKAFVPFISRTPASFLKSRDFFVRLLSVLRKFPGLEEGTYVLKTKKNIDDFKVGETYVFPSFALGVRLNENGRKEKCGEIALRISGKTNRGHILENDWGGMEMIYFFLLFFDYVFICFREDHFRA